MTEHTHTHYKYIHHLKENMDIRVRNRNFNNGYNKRLHTTEKMVSKLKHGNRNYFIEVDREEKPEKLNRTAETSEKITSSLIYTKLESWGRC